MIRVMVTPSLEVTISLVACYYRLVVTVEESFLWQRLTTTSQDNTCRNTETSELCHKSIRNSASLIEKNRYEH